MRTKFFYFIIGGGKMDINAIAEEIVVLAMKNQSSVTRLSNLANPDEKERYSGEIVKIGDEIKKAIDDIASEIQETNLSNLGPNRMSRMADD